MKLYYATGACSMASHIALIEGGVDFEAVKVDLRAHRTEHGEDFYAISPRGYVPAIETGFGLLTENPAVLAWIADETGTTPQGEAYYRLLEWIGFIGTEIHGGYHPLFGQDSDHRQAAAKEGLATKYRLAEQFMAGRDWLVGDTPGVADNYLFVTLLWARKFGVELPGALSAFFERNLARAAVQEAMKREGLS